MKRFIAIFSIFLFLSFNISAITAMAETKYLEQGFYKVKDAGLVTGSAYNVRNASPTGRAIIIVFDGNQLMQEFLRLEPNSQSFILKPLDFDYIVIIIGGGRVEFS